MPRKKVEKRGPVEALGPEGKPGVILATGEWVKAREEWWGKDPWGNVLGKWLYFRASRTSQLHGFYNLVSKKHGKVATGHSDYGNALPVYNEVCVAWNAGKVWVSPTQKQAADEAGTLNAYYESYRANHIVGQMTPRKDSTPEHPVYPYDIHIAPLLKMHGHLPLTAFTTKLCKEFVTARQRATFVKSKQKDAKGKLTGKARRFSAATILVNAKVAKTVFEQAVYDELIPMNPWRVSMKKCDKAGERTRVVEEWEEVKLEQVMPAWGYRWFRGIVGGGFRIEESCEIDEKTDVNLTPGSESVLLRRKGEGLVKPEQEVPLVDADAIAAFKEQLALPAGKANGKARPGKLWGMSQSGYRAMLRTACAKAGIEHITPHTLRHTFVTRYIVGGGDIDIAGRIVGHTNATMTRKYAHPKPKDLRKLSAHVQLRTKPVATGDRVVPFKKKA